MSDTHVTRFDGVSVPVSEYRPVWLNTLANDVTLKAELSLVAAA